MLSVMCILILNAADQEMLNLLGQKLDEECWEVLTELATAFGQIICSALIFT